MFLSKTKSFVEVTSVAFPPETGIVKYLEFDLFSSTEGYETL